MKILLDTSALAKRYVQEPGSDELEELFRTTATEVFICSLALPEFAAVLGRKVRNKEVPKKEEPKAAPKEEAKPKKGKPKKGKPKKKGEKPPEEKETS